MFIKGYLENILLLLPFFSYSYEYSLVRNQIVQKPQGICYVNFKDETSSRPYELGVNLCGHEELLALCGFLDVELWHFSFILSLSMVKLGEQMFLCGLIAFLDNL